ncbi:MAG: glycosyltransferase family 1 protein [Candidatus Parcubacteria bacterium]|nr:glycosyltransferase family 1 protein [Candidatus Parcubacteria bacterium]
MKIALDMSPLENGHYLQHRVRGTGFYLQNLRSSLEKYYPENKYIYFKRGDLLAKDIDVIHYPYFEPFFLTLPVFYKNKKIVTVHDLTPLVFPDHFKPGLRGNLRWQIQKLALKNANAIITDSNSSKKDIIKYAGINSAKITVVYLAAGSEFKKIEIENWKLKIKKRYSLPDSFVLYVGDATWNKNLPRLIEATSKINVPLVMVGKALIDEDIDVQNPWNKDLVKVQEMAKRNKNVFRLGFVSSEDLVALYNAATLFIMPSIYEGFGLPILEAMSCGCPVVASRGGSLAEVVGTAGEYVDPYDAGSISSGIDKVFNSLNLQKELSQKGITQAEKFTWRKTADETMDVYKSVISPE